MFIHYLSKYLDFFDTAFIILRGTSYAPREIPWEWYEVCKLNLTLFSNEKRIRKTEKMTPCPAGRFEGEVSVTTLS